MRARKSLKKLHAKGVIIDRSIVFISSINWSENSPRRNREVGIIIYGEPAEYFAEVFEYDWEGKSSYPIVLILLGAGFVIILSFFFLRKRKIP